MDAFRGKHIADEHARDLGTPNPDRSFERPLLGNLEVTVEFEVSLPPATDQEVASARDMPANTEPSAHNMGDNGSGAHLNPPFAI